MEQKALIIVVALLLLIGFFLFVPQGKEFRAKYLDEHFKKIGYFLKYVESKWKLPKIGDNTNKLSVILSDVSAGSMNGQSFELKNNDFGAVVISNSISVDGSTVTFTNNPLKIFANDMTGTVSFSNDFVRVSGKTNELTLGDFSFNKTGISFSVSGHPIQFTLNNVKKNIISFQDISGSLKWTGLRGVSPLLNNDKLELYDFDGVIEEVNGKVAIQGTASKIKLNGVNIVI